MLERFKNGGVFSVISHYFNKTPFFKKLGDALLIVLILFAYGVATGHVKLPATHHSVKASFDTSRQIQKILDVHQNKTNIVFAGHFNFHNGTQGLSSFNFMKYSLTEYSARLGVHVDAEALQNIPIVVNMPMVAALVDDKCFTSFPNPASPKYIIALEMGIKSYTACPVNDKRHNLVGFVVFGNDTLTPPAETSVQETAKEVQLFQH